MEHCAFCDIKSAVIDFTQGAKVAGLSACPDFATNGEQTHSPFYEERAQVIMIVIIFIVTFIIYYLQT